MIGAAVVGAALMMLAGGAGTASASTTCLWGGTPAEPTGTFTLDPGVTFTPAPQPLAFRATGLLSGGCRGRVTFVGEFDEGSTCGLVTFHGKVKGLPGVARFEGGGNVEAPSVLYDRHGNVAGVESPTVRALEGDSQAADCATPAGFTHSHFASVIELF